MIKQEITHIVLEYLKGKGKEKALDFSEKDVLINLTPADFTGDYTIVLFAFIKKLGMKPDELANEIAECIKQKSSFYKAHNLVKGFLNIELTGTYWSETLRSALENKKFGFMPEGSKKKGIMIEYPSPNTNKPLHLGHLRNIFLGSSLSNIMKANGYTVYQTCLYNDRGTNISKSMWAYLQDPHKKTPESSGIKGDHLVGDYYVEFSNA